MMSAMTLPANLDQLTADELRELVRQQAEVITRNVQRQSQAGIRRVPQLKAQIAVRSRGFLHIEKFTKSENSIVLLLCRDGSLANFNLP
ncbi:hypothetical protein ACHMW6_31780 [Pseudoduganella sp. UC29_106]|uniref:hypothetical protein n=1 Tax=Pseudoduganella sp. UC29_106 TaxID=3374553 RepID=UPI003756E595